MEKLIELVESTIENEDHTKILNIIMAIFVLFAPSISIMFLFNRALFMELDFNKLILICVVANVSLFCIIYFSIFLAAKKVLEKNESKNNQITIISKISVVTIGSFTTIIWGSYLILRLLNINFSSRDVVSMFGFLLIIGMGSCIFSYIKDCLMEQIKLKKRRPILLRRISLKSCLKKLVGEPYNKGKR